MIKARQWPGVSLIDKIVEEMLKPPDPEEEGIVCPKCGQNKGVKGYTLSKYDDTIEYFCVRCGRFVVEKGEKDE